MMKGFRLLILLLFPLIITVHINYGQAIKLSSHWWFYKGDLGGIWESVRVPQEGQPTEFPRWNKVKLPHCYNALDAVDPNQSYYQGPGWYRTLLTIENPYPGGHTFLYFEGAGQKTDVYIGLTWVGNHVGGYDAWSVDITEALAEAKTNAYIGKNYKGQIPVSIRCSNSRDLEMIPSNLSDFHIYGGLYRHVWLVYRPANWYESIKINANVDRQKNLGDVSLELIPRQVKVKPDIHVAVHNHQGEIVFEQQFPHSSGNVHFQIANPGLWTPSQPNLYTIKVEADFDGQKQVLEDRFGFRYFEFQEHGPFFLNGKRLLLRGTHRHEDFAGVAAAETEQMVLTEMKLIKSMGANFIRLGHYQQSKRVLELCDSLGILVWEEIPWCRGGLGGANYRAQARRMLTNMIEQHYNHPSIILWGLGNENDWPGDFETFRQDSIRAFMSELNTLSHQLDSSRVTSIRRCDFCKDLVDVYSPSIWPGWYKGRYTDYRRVTKYEMQHTHRFLHVEWGADCHVGRHPEDSDKAWLNDHSNQEANDSTTLSKLYSTGKNMSRDGDWSESYAVELYDWVLNQQEQMPWLTGSAFWTFKDFATPIRPENPIPYVNQKGVTERDLTPKEVFYVIQSYWGQNPMIHIYGHSWPIRWGAGGEPKNIKVYSNCDQVELFVNGKSGGIRKRDLTQYPAMGLTWDIALKDGSNRIKAVGFTKGQKITDEITWIYQTGSWDKPEKLVLTEQSIDSGSSFLLVTAVDHNGKVCLDSRLTVEFGITGDARLLEMQGTSTGSRKIQLANGQAKIKLFKTGKIYSASVCTEGLGSFLLH